MALERLWKARFELDKEEALKTENGYAVICNNKQVEITNLEYEYDVWATTRNKALLKAFEEGALMTRGLVAVRINDTHTNTRIL